MFLNVSRVEKFSSIGNVDIRVLNFFRRRKIFYRGNIFYTELAKWKQFGTIEEDVLTN